MVEILLRHSGPILSDVFEVPLSKRSVCCQVSFISPAIVHHSHLLLLCKQLSF